MSEPEEKFKPESLSTAVWDSDSDDGKPLINFVSDRVQIMKIIFKRISSKRITQMAPKCLKEMPTSIMKSVLLDELMGISNKRLISIINNTNDPTKSSSSSEEELMSEKPDDVISLDDISDDSVILDDSFVELKLSERERMEMAFESRQDRHKRKHKKSKTKHSKKPKVTVKKEDDLEVKVEKIESENESENEIVEEPKQNDPFVSALNLLELQARARAIRSQLLNEITLDNRLPTTTVNNVSSETKAENNSGPNSPNSVVILSPERNIVEINESSHSENEEVNKNKENNCNSVEEKINCEENHQNEQERKENEVEKEEGELEETSKVDLSNVNTDSEHNNIEKAPSPEASEKIATHVENEKASIPKPSVGVSRQNSTIEEDNDVLIMNEDEDILL